MPVAQIRTLSLREVTSLVWSHKRSQSSMLGRKGKGAIFNPLAGLLSFKKYLAEKNHSGIMWVWRRVKVSKCMGPAFGGFVLLLFQYRMQTLGSIYKCNFKIYTFRLYHPEGGFLDFVSLQSFKKLYFSPTTMSKYSMKEIFFQRNMHFLKFGARFLKSFRNLV